MAFWKRKSKITFCCKKYGVSKEGSLKTTFLQFFYCTAIPIQIPVRVNRSTCLKRQSLIHRFRLLFSRKPGKDYHHVAYIIGWENRFGNRIKSNYESSVVSFGVHRKFLWDFECCRENCTRNVRGAFFFLTKTIGLAFFPFKSKFSKSCSHR